MSQITILHFKDGRQIPLRLASVKELSEYCTNLAQEIETATQVLSCLRELILTKEAMEDVPPFGIPPGLGTDPEPHFKKGEGPL